MADIEQTGQAGTQNSENEKEFNPDVEITQEMIDRVRDTIADREGVYPRKSSVMAVLAILKEAKTS